jgi:hypothetical protein
MDEKIVVLDHRVQVREERALPLLLLGEPALDQGRVVVRFVVGHAVFRMFARRKKTERVLSLGMVTKSTRASKARRRLRGEKSRRRGARI